MKLSQRGSTTNVFQTHRSLLLLIVWAWSLATRGTSAVASVASYDLPIMSTLVSEHLRSVAHVRNATTGKFIPRNGWIAVRNSSDPLPGHYLGPEGFLARNPLWEFHFCGNEEKDAFVAHWFTNTSVLWAYEALNPQIGTAKAELWRLAVLLVHGGLYMDDDATIGVPLDSVVRRDDKFIVGKESYNWTDSCYRDDFELSNHSLNLRFGDGQSQRLLFDNRFFFNWALFAMPGNPLVHRILQHVVKLIKFEYLTKSLIKLSPQDHRGKLLMCASTFPITLAAREMVLEGHTDDIGLRVGGEQFMEYEANMKAWNNDYNPHRWVKQMQKHRMPYLRSYAQPSADDFEGKLIQPQGSRSIYLVVKKSKRPFPNLETFVNMKFDLQDVQMVSADIASRIPTGEMLPPKLSVSDGLE
jgi:hypothetical protein